MLPPPDHSTLAPLLAILHWAAGFVVLAEGLNKLERAAPLRPGLAPRARVLALLKVIAWVALCLGAGGALMRPFAVSAVGTELHIGPVFLTNGVSLADFFVLGGFALLILRSRFKEPKHHA